MNNKSGMNLDNQCTKCCYNVHWPSEKIWGRFGVEFPNSCLLFNRGNVHDMRDDIAVCELGYMLEAAGINWWCESYLQNIEYNRITCGIWFLDWTQTRFHIVWNSLIASQVVAFVDALSSMAWSWPSSRLQVHVLTQLIKAYLSTIFGDDWHTLAQPHHVLTKI